MMLTLRREAFFAAVALSLFCGWPLAALAEPDVGGSKAGYSVDSTGGTGNPVGSVGTIGASASPASVGMGPPVTTRLGLPVTPAPAPSSGNVVISLVFYLMILLLLAAVAIYWVRSGWPTRFLGKNTQRKLQVSEIRSLGNRQFLVVAEYETTKILLGVSHGRIDLLCHLGRDPLEGEDFAPLVKQTSSGPNP